MAVEGARWEGARGWAAAEGSSRALECQRTCRTEEQGRGHRNASGLGPLHEGECPARAGRGGPRPERHRAVSPTAHARCAHTRVHVYVCAAQCACTRKCVCVQVCVHLKVRVCTSVCVHVYCACACACMCTCTWVCACMCTSAGMCVHLQVCCACVCVCACLVRV